jgi:hypothetical protein
MGADFQAGSATMSSDIPSTRRAHRRSTVLDVRPTLHAHPPRHEKIRFHAY